MTREEMRKRREIEKAIKKEFLRPIGKSRGYKTIDRISYCVHDGWLYSIYVNAAFVPWSSRLEEWQIPISEAEEVQSVLEQAFTDADGKIAGYCEQIKTIQDFKELVQNHEPVNHLNCILCDIALGNLKSALKTTEEELSKQRSGGFACGERDIYEYVRQYCKNRL